MGTLASLARGLACTPPDFAEGRPGFVRQLRRGGGGLHRLFVAPSPADRDRSQSIREGQPGQL